MQIQKRRRRRRQDRLILNLLIIVTLVLVIFEGRLVITMIKHGTSHDTIETNQESDSDSKENNTDPEASSDDPIAPDVNPSGSLAGLPTDAGSSAAGNTAQNTVPTVSNPDSPAIVRKTEPAVDDSYFSDAVFIGDSRMEGFRNASGITQGRFFTSVGMSLASMTNQNVIQTPDGNITVAAALSGGSYNKIYIMLGTNDLGEYDWDAFREGFISVTERFQEIQPNAIFYICSVIYVEESKVSTGEYINNTNVDKINSILLDICEEKGYHYLDLNEFLSNGYGSLIQDATSDGVHIYPEYCEQMLTYLKSHYIPAEDKSDTKSSDDKKETDQKDSSSEDESETEKEK
ncbi:MAG: GDSL-type esterase/lipase family protein [Lachnospiraceae bacterium]|nr:GDSL-type esterase/lipase family protein [Lachnospiraceae bacterium]